MGSRICGNKDSGTAFIHQIEYPQEIAKREELDSCIEKEGTQSINLKENCLRI